MRYDYLIQRVAEVQPEVILEVGTWNGQRAEEMLEVCPQAEYIGFDLFEDGDPETDKVEFNVKPHYTLASVQERLKCHNPTLVKGNTRETLPAFTYRRPVDFVWLDGGHSVETIRSDWEAVKKLLAPWSEVWFDDYYTGGPDIGLVGCNLVVKDLHHMLHPQLDRVAGGGYVQMVRVWP